MIPPGRHDVKCMLKPNQYVKTTHPVNHIWCVPCGTFWRIKQEQKGSKVVVISSAFFHSHRFLNWFPRCYYDWVIITLCLTYLSWSACSSSRDSINIENYNLSRFLLPCRYSSAATSTFASVSGTAGIRPLSSAVQLQFQQVLLHQYLQCKYKSSSQQQQWQFQSEHQCRVLQWLQTEPYPPRLVLYIIIHRSRHYWLLALLRRRNHMRSGITVASDRMESKFCFDPIWWMVAAPGLHLHFR